MALREKKILVSGRRSVVRLVQFLLQLGLLCMGIFPKQWYRGGKVCKWSYEENNTPDNCEIENKKIITSPKLAGGGGKRTSDVAIRYGQLPL
ncbi:hypothetical protein AVEN_174847-1 [Araneus ventricosus]|uniref:Uncharacterized protein n=1 Tax=Araneus ventricosus TaxID=182803 RepID=A0A4Y2PCM2_ARAVE|nr:hypothetical protein AVEN_174847-1 [Araneus ventricosus]